MKKRKIINIVVIFIVLVAVAFGGIFYYKLNKLKEDSNEKQNKSIIKEKNNLTSKISELYVIPNGEVPTIATVSDPEVLKGKGFFFESLVGDKVFIFTKAKKAVLYRPSLGKIVDIVSINTE